MILGKRARTVKAFGPFSPRAAAPKVDSPIVGQSSASLDKSRGAIQEMFAGVAPRYDFLNHLLSGALDISWRRKSAAALALAPGESVLDVCCGTGDQALAVRKRGGSVVASDFCLPMLALAKQKYSRHETRRPRGLAADALFLPFADNRFDAATVSFGLRNVADLDQALAELQRVLRPAGRVAILEFAVPSGWLRQPYLFYFRRILPLLGKLFSPRGSAYSYLPSSVLEFPQRDGFTERMSRNGFDTANHQDLTGGTVCLYTGASR